MRVVIVLLSLIQVAIAIGLIVLIDGQQPKNEGLGGTVGTRASSSFKGMPGFEERVNDLTKYLGIGFFATCLLVAILASR